MINYTIYINWTSREQIVFDTHLIIANVILYSIKIKLEAVSGPYNVYGLNFLEVTSSYGLIIYLWFGD